MLPHGRVRLAALRRPISWRAAAAVTALAAALATSGCARTPPLTAVAADASAPVAPVRYQPVLGTYKGARPVDPAPWIGAPKMEGAR